MVITRNFDSGMLVQELASFLDGRLPLRTVQGVVGQGHPGQIDIEGKETHGSDVNCWQPKSFQEGGTCLGEISPNLDKPARAIPRTKTAGPFYCSRFSQDDQHHLALMLDVVGPIERVRLFTRKGQNAAHANRPWSGPGRFARAEGDGEGR